MDVDATKPGVDPRRYFEAVRTDSDVPPHEPVCLYLETTNRCNLLCTTCPRTYEELEPPADMSWGLFRSIVDQIPNLARAVLHGVGEPMLVKNLPRMVRHLKDRGTYVLFNTNGTVLNEKNGRALIDADLDELRVSFDAANAELYRVIRGKNYFNRILKNVRAFRNLQEREGKLKPRVSAWLTGMRQTVEQLPDFVRVAAETGVKEVYLQRLVFFGENAIGMARPDQALYEQLSREEAAHLDRAAAIAASLGITFSASGGASEPGMSLNATTTVRRGQCAAGLGRSCTSPPTAALCPAASRRFRSAVTRTIRSATPRNRLCVRSGSARLIAISAAVFFPTSRPRRARVAGCAGASSSAAIGQRHRRRHSDLQRSRRDWRRRGRDPAGHRRPDHCGGWRLRCLRRRLSGSRRG